MSAFWSMRASLAASALAATAGAVLHHRRAVEETAYDATDAITSAEGTPITIRQRPEVAPRAEKHLRRHRQSGIIGVNGTPMMWRP